MAGAIGSYGMLVFSPDGGQLQPAEQQVAMLEPSFAVDGNGVIIGAFNTRPQGVRTVVEVPGTIATATSLANSYRKLIGTTLNVVDQFGVQFTGAIVMGMTFAISAKAGFASVQRLEARWILLLPTARP